MKGVLLLCITCVTVASATVEDDISRAAISFLEKARSGHIDLAVGKDTAISPDTDSAKQNVIVRGLHSLHGELAEDRFCPGPIQVDGDRAAVIIRQSEGYDTSRYRTHAIGVVCRNGTWTAAPVPGSFENSGTGYDPGLRERERKLEDWMLRNRSLDLLALQEGAAGRLREEIGKRLDPSSFRKLDPSGFTNMLLSACERADIISLLACLGGADIALPDNWPDRLRAATLACADGKKSSAPWRMLAASDALRCVVGQEATHDKASVTLVCLDPLSPRNARMQSGIGLPDAGTPPCSIRLDLSRTSGGFWRFDPPDDFLGLPSQTPPSSINYQLKGEVLSALPKILREQIPATPAPSARAAADLWLATLRGMSLSDAFRILTLDKSTDYSGLARIWHATHAPSAPRIPLLLDFHEAGTSAVGICQIINCVNPAEDNLLAFYFHKSGDGWMLHPRIMRTIEDASKESGKDPEIISSSAWVSARGPFLSRNWQTHATTGIPLIHDLPAQPTPKTDDVRQVFGWWLDAIRKGDLATALGTSARLDDERSEEKLLRSLGSLVCQLRARKPDPSIPAIRCGGRWAGISLRLEDPAQLPSYLFFSAVMTSQGPRILPEIDLSYATNRTREYLNNNSWGRLASLLPHDAVEELHKLFEAHIQAAKAELPQQPAVPQSTTKPTFPKFEVPFFQPWK